MWWLLFPVAIYGALISYYTYHFKIKKNKSTYYCPQKNLPAVSVVIPLRNEAQHISSLVSSLCRLSYPADKLEIIWVNDHSTDDTWPALHTHLTTQLFPFSYQLITLEKGISGKKAALTEGIRSATHSIIASLDADCKVTPSWLNSMTGTLVTSHADMIIGPVLLTHRDTFFSKFMALEQLSLTATAAASAWSNNPILCSGANMIFYKHDFWTYTLKYAPPVQAGDDIFFMLFLKKNRKKISYLASTSAAVTTQAPASLKEFLNQRVRWVSKSRYYSDPAIILVALLVAMINISLVVLMICSIIYTHVGILWLTLALLKGIFDFPLLYMAASQFKQKKIIRIYPLAQLIYPIFVTYTSIYGNFGKYTWKQRPYSQTNYTTESKHA